MGFYHLDEQPSATLFHDSAGTNSGTCASGMCPQSGVTGIINVAAQFSASGSGQGISIRGNTALHPDSRFSLAAFVKPGTVGIYGGEVISIGDSAVLRVNTDGSITTFYYDTTSTYVVLTTAGVNVKDGFWHHIVGQKTSTGLEIYVDGVLKATKPTTGTISYTLGQDAWIGHHGNSSPNFSYGGLIDEARIYNTSLSATEILSLYQAAPKPTPSPTPITGPGQPIGSVSVTAYGAKGDGITDDTSAFQAATNTGKTVWVPRPSAFYKVTAPIFLRGSIIGDSSNLSNMPMIRMFGSNGEGYHTTLVVRGYHGTAQLVIAGLQIDNQYVSGSYGPEWDHNITISDSDNVRVTTNRLLNAWGDNVMIGEWKQAPVNPELDCKNIIVENNYLYNPFRCTVAPVFTSAGTIIRNNYHRKINRSDNGMFIPPIDLEPDAGAQMAVVRDVLIENNVVDTHTSDGLNLYFIFQDPTHSWAPNAVTGTRVRYNRGYWYGLSNSTLAEDIGNVFMDPAPGWTMQPFSQ